MEKYIWYVEVLLYGNKTAWVQVETDTPSWYRAEEKILAMDGVCDVGYHYTVVRPDGSISGC